MTQLVDDCVMTTYGRFLWPWNGRWMPRLGYRRTRIPGLCGWALALWDTPTQPLVETVSRQIQTLHHVSNLFYIPVQGQLAKWLIEHSCAERVFFCNLELKRTKERLNWRGSTLIRFTNRTAGDFNCQCQFPRSDAGNYYRNGTAEVPKDFSPLVPGFQYALQRYRGVETAITELDSGDYGGDSLEPLQGGGVRPGDMALPANPQNLR